MTISWYSSRRRERGPDLLVQVPLRAAHSRGTRLSLRMVLEIGQACFCAFRPGSEVREPELLDRAVRADCAERLGLVPPFLDSRKERLHRFGTGLHLRLSDAGLGERVVDRGEPLAHHALPILPTRRDDVPRPLEIKQCSPARFELGLEVRELLLEPVRGVLGGRGPDGQVLGDVGLRDRVREDRGTLGIRVLDAHAHDPRVLDRVDLEPGLERGRGIRLRGARGPRGGIRDGVQAEERRIGREAELVGRALRDGAAGDHPVLRLVKLMARGVAGLALLGHVLDLLGIEDPRRSDVDDDGAGGVVDPRLSQRHERGRHYGDGERAEDEPTPTKNRSPPGAEVDSLPGVEVGWRGLLDVARI